MTIYNQISNNKLRTFLIIAVFIFIVSGFFYLIGKFFSSSNNYLVLGLLFSLFSSVGSYFYSDKIILFTVGENLLIKEIILIFLRLRKIWI